MDYARTNQRHAIGNAPRPARPDPPKQKLRVPRLNLLIRAAKLITSHGEFVCVIRDISETGVGVRLFHDVPRGDPIELEMPSGKVCEMRQVRKNGYEVGYEFIQPINVDEFVDEASPYPKRGLRLGLSFPATVAAYDQTQEATVTNLSQQGARIHCTERFSIDQTVRIEGDWPGSSFGPIEAKVRWRRDDSYGVVFEDTLKLSEFARLAARLQCPALLESEQA